MEGKRTIIIDLDNSLYAHAFTSDQQIHQENLEKAMGIYCGLVRMMACQNLILRNL